MLPDRKEPSEPSSEAFGASCWKPLVPDEGSGTEVGAEGETGTEAEASAASDDSGPPSLGPVAVARSGFKILSAMSVTDSLFHSLSRTGVTSSPEAKASSTAAVARSWRWSSVLSFRRRSLVSPERLS